MTNVLWSYRNVVTLQPVDDPYMLRLVEEVTIRLRDALEVIRLFHSGVKQDSKQVFIVRKNLIKRK